MSDLGSTAVSDTSFEIMVSELTLETKTLMLLTPTVSLEIVRVGVKEPETVELSTRFD